MVRWKIQALAGLAAIVIMAMGGLYIRALHADLELVTSERDLAQATLKQCQSDQKITARASNDYQGKISDLNRRLADFKRVRDNPVCNPIANPTGRHHAGTGTGQPTGSHGLRTDWLLDYAAEAEKYRLQLIACQGFITEVWKRSP